MISSNFHNVDMESGIGLTLYDLILQNGKPPSGIRT